MVARLVPWSHKPSGEPVAITSPGRSSRVTPSLLTDRDGLRIHFVQDTTFERPKAFAFFLFRSKLLYASPTASVTAQQLTVGGRYEMDGLQMAQQLPAAHCDVMQRVAAQKVRLAERALGLGAPCRARGARRA